MENGKDPGWSWCCGLYVIYGRNGNVEEEDKQIGNDEMSK